MLYHAVQAPRIKRLFEIVDQSAIYLLTAGTYTPFTLVAIRGVLGWILFGVIWGLAVAGIAATWWFPAEKLRRPFAHAVRHLFVSGGSIYHYVAVRFYVAPA